MQLEAGHPQGPAAAGPVVLLTAGGPLATCIANALARRFETVIVLQEDPELPWHLIRRRARRLGWWRVLGQVACDRIIERAARRTRPRVGVIMASHGLDAELDASITVRRIASVNTKACRDALRQLQPAVVAVCDARIIRRETLRAVSAPFIGYHAGIYPKYRGRHPGYWALVNGEPEHVGVTVHLIEEGLGTGRVLYQERVAFTPEDDITTYPWVQLAHGLPLLLTAIDGALGGRVQPRDVHMPSRHWFPPTLWNYAWTGLRRGIW
jgi:folate-dependent phosphoribosylglycinamide formyltransferase PurN